MPGMTIEEAKARREVGKVQANAQMTTAERIMRSLVTGRPPSSEFQSPTNAMSAIRVRHREIEARMRREGLNPRPGNFGVSVGYVTPDHSAIGFTPIFRPGTEAHILHVLEGNIPLGLIFGIVDTEKPQQIVMGSRLFLATKKSEDWIAELLPAVESEIDIETVDAKC